MSKTNGNVDALWQRPGSVLALGEPLIELRSAGEGELRVSFGGDVANTMVCLARLTKSAGPRLSIGTALGGSEYSAWLRSKLLRENIGLSEGSAAGEPGIYGISPDATRQAGSSYWRSDSAARRFFHSAGRADIAEVIGKADLLIVTGITLALCSDSSFAELCRWAESNRQCRVVFDTNFRPALWPHADAARRRIDAMGRLASVIVTGLEDERLLWGTTQPADVVARIGGSCEEYIVRGGPAGCWVGVGDCWEHVASAPVAAVDPVGAGDAHLAGYLAARIAGRTSTEAADFGNRVAAVIVTQQGSIPRADAIFPEL